MNISEIIFSGVLTLIIFIIIFLFFYKKNDDYNRLLVVFKNVDRFIWFYRS